LGKKVTTAIPKRPSKTRNLTWYKNDRANSCTYKYGIKMTGQTDERWYKNDRADGIKMTPNKDNIGIYKDIRIFNKLNILFKRSKDIHGFDMFEPGSG
jgi:hypothetical protein